MSITSADFRSHVHIVNSFKLVHGDPWNITYYDGTGDIRGYTQFGPYDGVDINGDGQLDKFEQNYSWHRDDYGYKEPVLMLGGQLQGGSIDELKAFAKRSGTEVLLAPDLSKVMLGDYICHTNSSPGYKQELGNNPRSIGALVNQFDPLDKDASLAIDTTTDECLIYTPN